jgi:Ca2+-transporting ATPase
MVYADDLTLLGLVGLIDPSRLEAREAIRVCRQAGVDVKMITGDHRATVAAIARDLGLVGEAREGRELEGLDADQLADLAERTAAFARVAPEHRLRIVEAPPRTADAAILTQHRLFNLSLAGLTMAAGTLAAYASHAVWEQPVVDRFIRDC